MNTPASGASRPPVVSWLGYGGLIPFLGLAFLSCLDHEHAVFWHTGLRDYAAVILSFVGALHWGFAMLLQKLPPSRVRALFLWSVVPALAACVALLVASRFGDALLAGTFVAQYARDRQLAATTALPAWYLPLRLQLSAVAVLCIAAGACAASG